ncbi:MAG: hypothetical protein PHU04_04715 [Candidatus Peribacteraceae bacterium]|nr:hypothetical protein [Candidatus Peribacteraceae bacterium]
MAENQENNQVLQDLLDQVGKHMEPTAFPKITEGQVAVISKKIATFAQMLIKQECGDRGAHLSRVLTVDELSPEHLVTVCTMASWLASRSIDDANTAIAVLAEHGFEIRAFESTTFVPHDPRLEEAPNTWLFDQVQNKTMPRSVIATENMVMICEVRPKPDVVSDECWIQTAYKNDPFGKELVALHEQLDGYKPEKRIDPRSRAGFTFHELEQHILPVLSQKIGVQLECMPAIHACVLANDHPEISAGRSTEWRGDTIGKSHAVISGRSDRGPIRYVYYDVKNDPYPNRGFRLCVRLGSESSPNASPLS